MDNPFGNKLPDAEGFANSQASNAKNLGENKLNDAKNLGESKLNDTKNLGESKLNDAKNLGESKLNDAKNLGENKLSDAKNLGKNLSSSFNAGGFGSNKSSTPAGADNKEKTSVSGNTSQSNTSLQGSNSKDTKSQTSSAPSGGSGSPAAGNAGTNKDQGATEPKLYVVKPGEDLGSIAKKFKLTSWKYLYQLNKDKIGDNPDLLKAATELTIPQWDSTSGDEMIREKKADPFSYVGGLQYRYPWVPFSATFVNKKGEIIKKKEDNEKIKYELKDAVSGNVLASGEIQSGDELEILIPESENLAIKLNDKTYTAQMRGHA